MGKPVAGSSAKQTKLERRRDRREEQRRREEEHLRATKRNRIVIGVSILAVVLVVAVSAYFFVTANKSSAATLQSDNPSYPVVNNIACQTNEQVAYHVHAHLSMYINGQAVQIPQNLGIASDQSCFYWLH